MGNLLFVAAGGAMGASLRYLVSVGSARVFGTGFPVGTLAVNIIGCFTMGAFIALLAVRLQGSEALRLFVATGFLGGFTTFSAFSLDFTVLWERGETGLALFYAGASVVLSLLAVAAGLWLVRTLA